MYVSVGSVHAPIGEGKGDAYQRRGGGNSAGPGQGTEAGRGCWP